MIEKKPTCHYCDSENVRAVYDARTLPINFPQLYVCRKCEREGAMCIDDVPEWEQ